MAIGEQLCPLHNNLGVVHLLGQYGRHENAVHPALGSNPGTENILPAKYGGLDT